MYDLEALQVAYNLGLEADNVMENPYWVEYPLPSKKGVLEEDLARWFVDGWISKKVNNG